eukprot:3938551-Rhodomonas_salina.1
MSSAAVYHASKRPHTSPFALCMAANQNPRQTVFATIVGELALHKEDTEEEVDVHSDREPEARQEEEQHESIGHLQRMQLIRLRAPAPFKH